MLWNTTHRLVNSFITFRFIKIQFVLDNILCQNMSVDISSIQLDMNTVQQPTKRKTVNEICEIATKTQKVEDENVTQTTKLQKRRNHVIMLGYLGRNYFGMQINRGTKTIEESLLLALLKANFITKSQFEDVRELKFQRAARTDKGVSAVRQIVSLKLPEEVNKEDINAQLPEDIRVFGIKRVTKTFNSKNKCDARTYRFVLPTFALAPEDPNILPDEDEDIDEEKRLEQLSVIEGKPYNEFRLSSEGLDKLNEALKLFEGTHNFHNFTSKTKPMDPRARRYIIHFRCAETFIENDMEFAVVEIKGQSFMLHQIRKMVSLVLAICRNIVTTDIIKDIFSLKKYDVPIAPSLGLSLHFVHYTYYDERYGKDGLHQTLDWNECYEEVEQFYKEHILKDIINRETTEKLMLNWLVSSLTPRRFDAAKPSPCEYIL